MSGLTGRVALVTGANRRLGLEAARQLAALGALVLLGARDRDKAVAAAQAIGAPADRGVLLDVTRAETVDACATFIDRTLGRRLDILVNNAAIHYDARQTPLSADLEIIREAYETNVIGAWRLAQMAARFMRPRRWGRIVNVSSEAGSLASMHASAPAYRASKLALNGLTLMLADELRGSGILVNAVCPGWVATDMGGRGGRPIPDGARSIVWAATLDDDGPTGGFFRDGKRLRW
jgi:NAD(P)-dependent dehydrogenase (short-subunit alcohol dehydrogenase family)